MRTATIAIICFLLSAVKTDALDCKDENNNPVDWFIVYKLPKIKNYDELAQEGGGYMYITSENIESWTYSKVSIAQENSIIGNTLQELYHDHSDLSYILYNDQPPNHSSIATRGHTKGAVVADNKSGFWFVHSVPKFPDVTSAYSFPDSAKKYGQSFICISMDLANINTVGLQLQYNQPQIYLQHVSSAIHSKVPHFVEAAENVTIKTSPWFHVTQILSKNDVSFTSFAKHARFNQDLYVDLVGPYVKSDLDVETWLHATGRLPSDCSVDYSVFNVKSVSIPFDDVTFTSGTDHSKWAVSSKSSKKSWVCVGDINRAEHQLARGGGTICTLNKKLAKHFQKLVGAVEECSDYDDSPFVLNF